MDVRALSCDTSPALATDTVCCSITCSQYTKRRAATYRLVYASSGLIGCWQILQSAPHLIAAAFATDGIKPQHTPHAA
jgi:hypothetical protein